MANSHYNSVGKTKLSSLVLSVCLGLELLKWTLVVYETPQNHLVDFLTLLHKLQRETSPKNLLKPLPFCDLCTRKGDAYQRLLTFFCVACAKKCLYAVLLNANNIRLLTKCDAALLSFRYTSIPHISHIISHMNERMNTWMCIYILHISHITYHVARPCGLMFDPSPLEDNPTWLEIDKSRSVYTQPRTLFPLQTTTTSRGNHPYSINL